MVRARQQGVAGDHEFVARVGVGVDLLVVDAPPYGALVLRLRRPGREPVGGVGRSIWSFWIKVHLYQNGKNWPNSSLFHEDFIRKNGTFQTVHFWSEYPRD